MSRPITLVVPGIIPVSNARHVSRPLPPTYLPALEGPRERGAFASFRITDLQVLQPGYVVIGDSMAGTRIDERRLIELTRSQVAPLLQPGSGSAFWYLAVKNWVIASGVRPRLILIFFRDTNLTDVMFRLDEQFRGRSTWRPSRKKRSSMRSSRDASACCIGLAGSSTGSSVPSRRGNGLNRPSRRGPLTRCCRHAAGNLNS